MKDIEYVVWSGKLSVKGLYGCCVQIVSPELLNIPVKLGCTAWFVLDLVRNPEDRFSHVAVQLICRGTSINISCKVGLKEGREKFLHRVTSLKRGIETYSEGWYINACWMKVNQPKSNFEKIRHYLTGQECMAVLKLEEDILLMMTDNEVTNQLGLTETSQESNLHCLFLSKTSRKQKGCVQTPRHPHQIVYQTKRMDEKGDYDHTGPIATQQSWRLIVDRSNTEHGQLRSEIGRSSTDHGLQRTDFEMARFQGLRTDTIPPKKELSLSGTELAKEEPVQFEHEIHSKEYEKAANRLVPEHPQALLPPEQGLFDSDKDTVNVQAPIVLESDRSLQSALGRIFGDTEIVESSRSPFPESYTELIVDQSSGNRIGFDLGGVLAQGDAPRGEGEGPFHPSPEYSNKLAEALSLSCQEGGQKLSENDDLPPLISWLPVNISETASTPKSPLGKPKPMTPQLLDSHQHFFSDQNNNLGNIGANNSNIANPRHFEENLGLNLSQSLEHQIGSCRSLTPPPPYLHQEAFEMLHSSQKSLSRPPSLETVYSKYSPDSSRGNSSLGASLKSDSLCTPNSGNSLSTPLGNNSFGTSFPGNTSDTSSHFIPSNSNIQSAPLDVSFIKQEPEDDYWSTSLTSETISHPVETVNPNALEDTSLHWPRHFMDAFLEAKQNRNPCIRNMHDEDSPMFTPEHKLDDDENLGLSRIPHLEKSLNNPRYEAEAAGRSPIYGPIAGQAEDIYRQAKDIGNLAETVCELLESDQMDLDDLIDIKGEPEVVNRLYSEYQEELKGLPEKPSAHRYRCSSVSDITRNKGRKMDNNGKHPQIHLLLDNGFWPKPPRTSLLKHSRVRESFIEQAKKRMTNNYGSLKRSCSLFELKELIEKYGTEKLEVPKRLTPKEVKTADISKKDKKSVSKTSKKKDKSKVVDLDIVDLERREELMDVDYSSRTDISQKVGHDIKSLIKTPDRLLPKVVLEKLDLSGKKSCRLGEPLENKGSGKKPIKLKLILSPENRVDHAKANRHLKADVGNSSEDEIDSDAPLDTVLKMKALHSAEKEKRRKISGNNKLIEEMIQDRSSKTGLDTTHDKTGAGPCDNETLKTKACDEKTERKERTRKQSESDSKHSSHHHKKHKHEKHKHKSKHSHKSNDDKTNASLKEVHSDKPKADNLESDSIVAVETQDQQAMDQSENKDTSLSDHIQAESEKKNKTPVSGLELLAELSKNETIETNRTRESKKDTASENGNDISCIESVAVANKTALEKSLKSPEQGSESKTHDKKKHKDKRKENDLKTKDKHVSSFTKALDDIVSAKVDEIVAGSKKRKAEENRTDPDRIERKHKTGSPKRKQSKTEAEKVPSKVKRTHIKTSSLSRKQEAADRVLSALNMGVSKVQVSSLGRIPKKQSLSSSKKIKKEEDTEDDEDRAKKRKTGEKENVGKTSKDNHHASLGESGHKKESKGKTPGHKDKSKCTATETDVLTDNRKRHFSANSASERGCIATNDEMIHESDFDDFVDNQKPLYKIGDDANDNLKEQGTSLFTSVMATRPETGMIPGLGDLESRAMSPTVETWKDLSKRQVLKSGSGLKCVLSGYDPVHVDDRGGKVDITECLLAALHRIKGGKQPKKDFWSESIHTGLHSTADWREKKSVSKSVNMKGTTTVLIVLDVKPDHIEHTEKEKEKTADAKDSKASPVENSSSNKTEDRQTGDTAGKKKKSDLVLNIPEKMVVNLEESLDELDSTEGNVVIDEMAKDDIDIRDVEETSEPSQTLNMSFGTSLKQNLLVVHDIKTGNLYDGYDKLSESYAGEESKAGPEKATAAKASPVKSRAASAGDSAKTGPIKTKVSSGDASKTAPAKPPDVDKTDSSLVVDVIVKDKEAKKEATNTVNVTVHLDEDLAIKHKEKVETDEAIRKRHSSSIKESKDDNADSRDRKRRSRSKSGDWLVLSSEGLSVDIGESTKEKERSPTRRRSRSKSKSKDETELAKSSGSRSRNNSESKSSRSSREKSMPKESTSEKNSRASSEVRDDKSVSKRRHSSEAKVGDSSKEDKDKKSIGERLETLSKKSVPASEAAKADSRHSRQYHPYKKEEKKERKSRKPKWSFDMAYRDMNELLQNLTTNFFKQTNKKPAPIPKTTNAKSYDRKPRRFAGYRFERSEIPRNMPRTRSPSPFDPEEDNLGPEMIPDLAERQEKADELEEQFMQTTVASEDEEYNREQDIYSQDEDEDGGEKQAEDAKKDKQKCGKTNVDNVTESYNDGNDSKSSGSKNEKADDSTSKLTDSGTDNLMSKEEKKQNLFPDSKGDMPDSGSLKSLSTLVVPGPGKSFLFSGIELDEENDYSLDILGGPPSPLGTEISLTVPHIPLVSKTSTAKGVTFRQVVKVHEKTLSATSTENTRDENQLLQVMEPCLPANASDHKSSFPDTNRFAGGTSTDAETEKLGLGKKIGNQNQITACESGQEMVSEKCKTVVNKVKDRSLLLSVDSDSCLDWTDDDLSAEKVAESTAFASHDEFSDIGEDKSYLVVDSIGDCDHEYDESKQESDKCQTRKITSRDNPVEKNLDKESLQSKSVQNEMKNTLNDDEWEKNDGYKNVQPDETEFLALKLSPTQLNKDKINNLTPISALDKTETDTGVRTELMNSEIPTTENRDDESILTTKTDTHINLEETINNTELSPLVDKGDNVSEADLSVDVGDANDSTDISKSLDLSKSPLLVIDESVSGNKMSPSFEENEVRSKPDPCIRMLEHGNDVNLKSVGNSAERMTDMSMASNVTEDLEVLQKTENDAKTQATSEIHGKTICQSDEMSNSSAVQLELAELDKKDCEKQYKMDVHSTHTTEFSSVMAEREAGSIIFVDDIDTVEEEITNDSPTTEGDDRQKRDSSLVYLDDTVSSCDEDPSNTVATYNNIERKEEGPSIVYLDDTVTSADEAVTELTDDTDVIFVKKTNIEETKIEESGDDVIYIPEATEEVEIVNLQDTTDPNKFFSCQGKEEKQDMQMYSSEVEPVDLSCHGHEKQIVGKDEIYIVADEGVNTDETVSAYHDEDESNDRTDVVGVVNSGLDSEEKIEDQNIERSIASAEPPNMDKTFAVTSFSGKPYLTDKSNNEPYQTDASQSLASDVSTIAHSCSLPGLPVDTVTTTHRPAVYSEQFVPTVNIAVTRSQGNMTTTFAVPTCTARYPTRSVAAVAPLSSVSTPSHGKVEPDNNCEWISPPSQPAYPHVVSPSSEAVNLSHSIPSLGQSPFGSYMVPVTSTGQENSPDPMPGPYFVSPYLSPSPLNPGVQLLGSSPFSSRTVMPPFSSAIQTAEWPHTSPASNYYSPRGLVSLGSTIYDSASWQNYQAVYRGSNPQLYPSANIQQIQQPPGSAAQLQPWMFSVRLPPEFRPTNPNTFFSVIQPRFYTFPNLLYRSLSNLNHTNNFDPFGKTFTIPTLRELCTKNIENDDVLKSAAAQSFSRQLTEGQKPLTDDLDITNKVIPESVGSQRENMTVDCFNPYRERVDLQGNEKGLQFSDATSCKGLAENNHLLGTPLTICPKSTLEIPENTYSEDEKHLLASETASGSHQNITHDKSKLFMIANNITDTLGTPKKFNAQNTTEANQYERQCNLDNYDSTERSVDAMKLYEKMNGADVNQEGQKTMSRKECKEKRIIGEMEEFYSSIDSLLNEVDTKDSGQALERKRRQIEDAGKSSATEFLEQKQFSDSIKNACDTEESFSKLPFMEGYQGEKFRIKETELTENTNTDEKTMTKRGKEIEGFDGEINGFNKNDDPLLLRSDIKDCLKALEVKRKEIEDAAKSNAVEVFGINKDETCDMKTVPVSDSYVWNGKIIPLNKQIGPERADLGGQLELGENSYLNDKHGNKCSVMPVDRVSKMDNFSGSTGEKSCMRETQQQNELEMIGLKKTSAALDKTSFSETMLVTDCVSPVKCLEEATEREESISKLPYKENFKAADRCRKNHTNMEVTKTVSKEDKTMTSRDKEHEIFEDEKDNFLKSDDPLLLREDIKDCLKALEIKRKEIKDASKSNAVEVLGTNNDVTCDMKTVWNDKIMPVGSKGADNGGLLKLVESSFFNGNHENVNPVLPVDGSFEMGSHSESIVENSSLIEINHQNDIEMRESDMSNNFEASLDKMLKAETSHITDCVTPTVSANESSAIEGSVSKLTFMVSFEEGTSEIEYADKGVTEKASKEERTNTDRDVEHENLCDEIGDSNKTDDPLLPRGDIKDCIDAIEAKRRELRDAASVNSYKEGKSEIKCSAKEVSEKASKEDKTKTVSGQEQENLSGEIGDSYKSFDPLIKDCLQALEIKRKELKDAAKSNAVETLGLNKVETCELKTVPLTDSCYIWNGEMIPLNKTIGPEREDNGNRFELVENCHSNDRQDNVSSDIPVDSCLEKGNYSASTVESSGLREMQQQNGIGLMATDSLMESYKKETSEIKHTDMEYTENTSKEDESKISKAEEQAILEEEVDGVNKTVNPLLLNTDIKDCLKALEIKRKEIEDAAQSNAIEVLELESMTENISLKQSDQMIPQLTQSRSGCEKREKIVDKDSRNDTNELEHNQMDQSKDLGLKSVKFEKVAEKRLVDYEEEDENSLHSSDAKSKLNIVAYEDNDTDDENDNEGVETEIDRTICAETLPPSTNIKQPDAEEKELRKYTTDEKQAQEKMVENETDNCNISVVSEKVSCQLSTTAGNMQEEKDSDSQFSLLKISQGQLKPASDIQHIRVAELDKGMESIFEDIVTGFSEVVKYSDTNDKLSQLSDVESDDELYQEILSPVFTDEETEFSDSSSLTMKPAKQEAKSKSVLQNNLSISLLSSAYDDETDDESNEATDLSKAGKSDFKDPLAALKGYTNENSDSSDSESASSSGESSSNSSDDESELTDNQYEAAKGSNTLLNAEYEMSSSDELRDELLEKGLSANSSQTNVVKAAETKDKFGDEMDKYMKCKWVEEGILSPDNSDTESVCNTSCGSPDTLKAISDTEELYQSDAIIHQTPKPQSSEGDVLDSSANDGKPSLLSTKRAWLNRTKGRQSILTESDTERTKSDTEKTNTLEASFAESSVSNVSNLSLAKLEQRQKRLINKILMQSDSDSSVTTGSGSGSESSAAKVKAAVTKKLADIRFWIQKGEDANQRDINEAIQKKTEVTKNLSRKETKLLRRKMLMEKLEQARLDCPSSDNDDRQYAKLETSRGYSVITIDSTSGSNKETKSSGELSDSKSAGELSFIKSAGELSYSKSAGELSYSKSAGEVSYSKSAGELSDSTLSVKSASTVRSLGQRPEADLRAVVITIKNDRAEATSTSKSDYQRTSSPISPPTRKRTQSGRQNDSLEYVSDNFDTKFNKDIELPSQYSNKIYHQDSYKTRTETEKLPYNRHAGSAPGMYSDQENRTTVVRSEQPKAFRERHRSSSGSISSLASDSEANKQKTWNRNEHKTSNIRESPRRSRRDGPYLYGSRASSREPLRSDSRGYRKRSSSLTRCRKESRSLSRGSSLSSSRSHSKGKLNSVSPSRRFRASKSRSPSMRSRSRSGSLRQRTGSRSGNARGRSRSPAFQRRSRSPATKRQDSQASSSNVRHYTSRNRSTSGMFRNRSRSPGLRSRSGSRDSRQSRYSGHERCRRSTSRESGALSTSSSDRGFDERFTARRDNENRERERFYSERFSSRNEIGNRSRERDVIPTSVYQDSEDARKKNLDYISRWNNSDRQWSGGYDSNTSSKQPTFAMRAEARSLIDEMKDRDGREVSGKRKDLARYEVKTLIDKNKKREMRDSSEKISTKSVGGGARFDLRKKLGHKESTLDHKDLFRSDHKPNRTGDLSTRSGHFTNRRTSQDRVHRDIQLVVKREKIVILHSSVLAYEKQDDLFELIKSLAQYSTSTCHWKALIHSRMICDLDEWRSVNPDCGGLLELLSRYRADDHVELLPFHGCDENKMTTVQCAEQILRERDNVQMAFLIGGKSFAIQIRTPPAEPTVCTEDPVEQLDYLISRGRKTGKGLMYICIGEHKGTKEKPFTEFTYSVVVDGVTYKGTGRSKTEAKAAAAKSALIGRFKILSVPMVKRPDLISGNPQVVICNMEDFFELHLSSKHV